jgi:hypothetical protein
MSQPITSPFRWAEYPRPSIFLDDKKSANQHTAGRKVNLEPMPATSFCSHIATPKESDRTNSIKRTK